MNILAAASWLVIIVYSTIPSWWLLIHPFAGFWRKRQRSPYRALIPIWILMWIAVGATTWNWREVQLYRNPSSWIFSALLLVISIFIYRRTRHEFGRDNLIGQSEVRPTEIEQRLVTTGLHARIRHPVYLAHLCTITAFTVGSGLLVNYALLAFALITGVAMIHFEERELNARFGDAWRAYKSEVPLLIPRIRRREAAHAL